MQDPPTLNRWLRKVFNGHEWPSLVARFRAAQGKEMGVASSGGLDRNLERGRGGESERGRRGDAERGKMGHSERGGKGNLEGGQNLPLYIWHSEILTTGPKVHQVTYALAQHLAGRLDCPKTPRHNYG